MKPKEKSPYVDLSIEEVQKAEAGAFVIQLGTEFYDYKGRYTFSRESVEKLYDDLYAGLHEMLHDNNKRNKSDILSTILNFRILPLRFH